MAIKSKLTVKRQLRDLRKLIENTDDPIVTRIAYAMECAVRSVTEDVVGWPTLRNEAIEEANLLKDKIEYKLK